MEDTISDCAGAAILNFQNGSLKSAEIGYYDVYMSICILYQWYNQ